MTFENHTAIITLE